MLFRVSVAPICRQNQSMGSIGAAVGESVDLECSVDASPASVTFEWTANRYLLRNHVQHSNHGLTSRLSYRVQSKDDFGTVECAAKNAIGRQRQPCLFHIIAAGLSHCLYHCLPFFVPSLQRNRERKKRRLLFTQKKSES